MDIRYLNRHNICGMSGKCKDTRRRFSRNLDLYPCFAKAFYFVSENSEHVCEIDYDLRILKQVKAHTNNFALFSVKDMCRLLNSFKAIIPFTFKFSDAGEYYSLTMHLNGTALQHKGLLMLSRSLFQYPHNMCALDALRMRDLGMVNDVDTSKIPLFDLYFLGISSTNYVGDECFLGNHRFIIPKTRELQENLARLDGEDFINRTLNYNNTPRDIIKIPTNTQSIYDKNAFLNRVSIYIKNYYKSLD